MKNKIFKRGSPQGKHDPQSEIDFQPMESFKAATDDSFLLVEEGYESEKFIKVVLPTKTQKDEITSLVPFQLECHHHTVIN